MTEKESSLWQDYWQRKSRAGLNALISQYTPLVYRVFNKHYAAKYSYEEHTFISWGLQGLWRAIESWQGEGYFLSYGYGCILRSMRRAYQYVSTRQQQVINSKHKSMGDLVSRERHFIDIVDDKEETEVELKKLFGGHEKVYPILLEMYGNETSSTELYKKQKRRMKKERKWKTLNSFKSSMCAHMKKIRERASA